MVFGLLVVAVGKPQTANLYAKGTGQEVHQAAGYYVTSGVRSRTGLRERWCIISHDRQASKKVKSLSLTKLVECSLSHSHLRLDPCKGDYDGACMNRCSEDCEASTCSATRKSI